jgi:hypothetical protein
MLYMLFLVLGMLAFLVKLLIQWALGFEGTSPAGAKARRRGMPHLSIRVHLL